MTKRKVKEELKKPDFVMVAFEGATVWIKEHLKLCVIAMSALVVIALAITGYRLYEAREDDRLQYQLQQGIALYQEYTINGNSQALQKAESNFKTVSSSRHRDINEVAELYLARIYYIQGKTEDARSLYTDVKNRASNALLKKLADTGLQNMSQPAK